MSSYPRLLPARRWLGLIGTLLVCFGLAACGSLAIAEVVPPNIIMTPSPSTAATPPLAPTSPPPTATPAPATALPPTATPPPPATATPVPPTATPGPPRIGLQAGHWRAHELPEELSRLRGASGGSGGGRQEWEFNLEVTELLASRLRAHGYLVDILPATVPPGYQADLFLAIHADASLSPGPRGFKISRGRWSRLPVTDEALVRILREEYGQQTNLPWDANITRNMTGYYAFNNRRRDHAIHKTTPGAIIETGFLTNAADRHVLFNQVDRVVTGIERGVIRFVEERPPLAEREQPTTSGPVVTINDGGATVRGAPRADAPALLHIDGGRRQDAPDIQGEWVGIWITELNGPGWVHRSEATVVLIPLP